MGWNADGTCTTAGGGFNANRSSVAGGVFGTDDAPPQRQPPRRQGGGFSLDQVEQAESRDNQHMQQMQQQQMMQQRQQQAMMQQQRQQQGMQQQQQMQQQQMMQRQQQQMMQQRQQQQQMQQQQQPPSPDNDYDRISKKNTVSSISLGGDAWSDNAPSHRGRRPGGRVQQGVTPKECGLHAKGGGSSPPGSNANMAAGGYVRDQGANRYDNSNYEGRTKAPGGGSSISLGSDAWNGSAPSPRYNKSLNGRSAPMRGSDSPAVMRSGPGAGMGYQEAPAAGGGQRPDQRAHLGSNICFG